MFSVWYDIGISTFLRLARPSRVFTNKNVLEITQRMYTILQDKRYIVDEVIEFTRTVYRIFL